jgi:Flp pilus assembly CpaE family ATPase
LQRGSTTRKAKGIKPAIEVQVMVDEKGIRLSRELVDILILDLPGQAGALTLKVAAESDLMVVVTDTNVVELEPTVALLDALKEQGFEEPRVVVALSKVHDQKRGEEARTYLSKAGFNALDVSMMNSISVHDVLNDGRSPIEVSITSVAQQAKAFVGGLMVALTRAIELLRAPEAAPAPAPTKGKGRER